MATTGASRRSPSRLVLGTATRSFGGLALLLIANIGHAQQWAFESGIASTLSYTTDAALGSATGSERDDTVLQLSPRFSVRREGARLKVAGSGALSGVAYANSTQPSRVFPIADLAAQLEAIERWFYLDAGLRALQSSADPFGVSPGAASTTNTITTTQVRLSPYIESSPTPGLRYRLSSDNVRTSSGGSTFGVAVTNASGYFARNAFSIERDPKPLGLRLEAERSETRYDDTDERLILDLARLSADYALGEDFTAGVRGGYERNSFSGVDNKGSIYGVQAAWRPSQRTSLSASSEKRFFGTGWALSFDHRAPRVAWSLALQRRVDTSPQSLFTLPATDNVAGLLDATFTTRFPDPVERARIVQDFIAQRGLPPSTLGPTNIYARRLSIVTSRSATVLLIGSRNTVALSGFNSRIEDVSESGPFDLNTRLNNNVQYGASIVFSRRLSTTSGFSTGLEWRHIRSLETVGSDRTDEGRVLVQLSVQPAARTSAYVGLRYRLLDSNAFADGEEVAVFVGIDQRF